jgi:glycosyltransferase involved in cell wall biosynthesis
VRVGVPGPFPAGWDAYFRSAGRVWSNVTANLAAPGFEVVSADPDVWLWDAYRDFPDSDRPLVAVVHEAPIESEGVSAAMVARTDAIGRLVCDRAVRVVTCSSASRERIADRYGIVRERIDVAPYGVDLERFVPEGPVATAQVRAAGGDDRPYMLFVGTVMPRKNLPLLRRAMEDLPSHQLVLVASPAFDRESTELLAEAVRPIGGKHVANLSGIDEDGLVALMRGASVLCLPSSSEGFGLPVVEAMACGTPVVVSDRGSLPEVVGEGGIIVPPTSEDLVAGLREALRRREELAPKALRQARTFTWARTATLMRRSLATALGLDPASAGTGH